MTDIGNQSCPVLLPYAYNHQAAAVSMSIALEAEHPSR